MGDLYFMVVVEILVFVFLGCGSFGLLCGGEGGSLWDVFELAGVCVLCCLEGVGICLWGCGCIWCDGWVV